MPMILDMYLELEEEELHLLVLYVENLKVEVFQEMGLFSFFIDY